MSPFLYLAALAALIAVGPVLVTRAVAFFDDRADERAVRKAETILTEPPAAKQARLAAVSRAAVVSPKDASGLDALWLELLVTPSVPEQRRPDGAS